MSADPTGATPERRGGDRVAIATILVVDDSRAVRQILRRALEPAGYHVEEAGDGEQALAACRNEPPDLVLLDVDMPVMDGIAALTAMKADEALSSIPVLFLTARTGGVDVARGLDLGAQDYLRKPCDPVELSARVASALRVKVRDDALAHKAQAADEASTKDPLTGLGNRRYLDARMRELSATAGPDAPVGLILVDIDHFKRVNDEEGHPAGDVVLRILARRLTGLFGTDATLVRWGGEEFLVVNPYCTGAELVVLAERLRTAMAGSPFSLGDGRLLDVTVSAGCAFGTLGTFDGVLHAADVALYDAKSAGRNRVCLSTS